MNASEGTPPPESRRAYPHKDRRVPALRARVAEALEDAWARLASAGLDAAAARGVVVACSGGPDSTVLLDALAWLRRARLPALRLVVAHYRHGLHERDDEAAAHLGRLTAAHGVPLISGDWAVEAGEGRARAGEGLEDAARRARYAFLARLAVEQGCALIATGHTLNDQAETMLMRLIGGTGLAGLQGMAALRAHDAASTAEEAPPQRTWLVRPLLAVHRHEVDAYRRAERLDAVDDPTNADQSRLRNRIRHTVMPELAALNPSVAEHLAGLAEDVRAAAAVLEAQVAAEVARRYDATHREFVVRHRLHEPQGEALELKPALIREALKRVLTVDLGLPGRRVTRQLLSDLVALAMTGSPAAKLALPAGWWAHVIAPRPAETATATNATGDEEAYVTLRFLRTAAPDVAATSHESACTLPVTLESPGEVSFDAAGRRWHLRVDAATTVDDAELARHERDQRRRPAGALLAASALQWPLTVRGKRPGEPFRPLGAPGHRPVRELLRERRVPAFLRESWPLLVDAAGTPLWLVHIAVAEAARLTGLPAPAHRCTATTHAHHE